ncbi:MAG: hypothetical protein QM487_11615 [Candidatus Marithrix sp.]
MPLKTVQIANQQEWKQFEKIYDNNMQHGNFLVAAKLLKNRQEDASLKALKDSFKTIVIEKLGKQVEYNVKNNRLQDAKQLLEQYLEQYDEFPYALKTYEGNKQVETWLSQIHKTRDKTSATRWIFIFLSVVIIALFVAFAAKTGFLGDFYSKLCQKGYLPDIICHSKKPPKPDYHKQFLDELKSIGWKKDGSEQALKELFNESEIEQALEDLKDAKGKALSVSLLFVPVNNGHFPRNYLEKDLTNFSDDTNLSNIVETQKRLRSIFKDFQKVAPKKSKFPKEKCRLDSNEYPTLSFACRVALISYKVQNIPAVESEFLPFFSKYDIKRAKSLKQIADEVKDKVIEISKDINTLDTLCRLGKQEDVESNIAYELKQQDDDTLENMAQAVIKFIKTLPCDK